VYECPDEVSSNQGKFENLLEVPEGVGWKCLRPEGSRPEGLPNSKGLLDVEKSELGKCLKAFGKV
jgi:hypothetical protein